MSFKFEDIGESKETHADHSQSNNKINKDSSLKLHKAFAFLQHSKEHEDKGISIFSIPQNKSQDDFMKALFALPTINLLPERPIENCLGLSPAVEVHAYPTTSQLNLSTM